MKLSFEEDKVISKSNDVDSRILGNISSIYLKYTKDSNQNLYSSYSTQPISNIYCTTKLNDAIKEEQILIGKCNLNEDNKSVLSNFYLKDVEDEEYKEKFNIFNFKTEESKKLELQQLEAILCSIFACNFTSDDRVYIICDEEGDNYNNRAIDILKQIYIKLPYFMRKSIGYNTYSVGNDSASRIKLGITTRSNFNIEGEYVIDLQANNYYDVISGISQKIKKFVDFLLSLEDNELIYIYDEVYNIYGVKNLTMDKFITVFDYIDFYNNKELDDELIENYIYDIKRANEHPEQVDSELYKKMVSDIKSKLNDIDLNNYIRKNFNNTIDLCNIDSKALDAFLFIYYLEDMFRLDLDLVKNWIKDKRVPCLEKTYNYSEIIKILKNDRDIIENLETKIKIEDEFSECKRMDLIKDRAISSIDKKIYELNQEAQKFIKEERNYIKDSLQNANSLDNTLEISKTIIVKYSENNNLFKQEIENKLLFIMTSYKNYLDLNNVKFNDISEEEYNNLCEDIKLYYDNDKNIIEELFKNEFIENRIKDSVLDKINTNFENDAITTELNYYNNLILNKANDLNDLGNCFKVFIQKLKYPDKNKYELEKNLNLAFEKQLDLDKQGNIDISIDDLRYFLNKYRNFLSEENINNGYDYLKDKLYSKVNDTPLEESKSSLDEDVMNIVLDTIYKVVNKDINRFFRSLILIQQDSSFENRLEKAKENYAKLELNEKAFLIFDNTLFRTAEQGFVLTEKYVYYKSVEEKTGRIPISYIDSITSSETGNVIYINDVSINCEIIGGKYRKEFKNLVLSIFYLLQNIDGETDIEQVAEEVLCFQ